MDVNEKNSEKSEILDQKSNAYQLKYKIAISGAAETEFMNANEMPEVETLGRLIAERGIVTVTGATTGAPYWAARGAKEAGGIVIGISPAATKREHVQVYHLPLDYHDLIIYVGGGYSERNLIFTRAADAVIYVGGRIGTLNEFTDAFEDNKPQGVLLGTGGTTDDIEKILADAHRGMGKVVFDTDPQALLLKVVALIEKDEEDLGIE
jgi:uncharacterized protein (TIGR00725 family)